MPTGRPSSPQPSPCSTWSPSIRPPGNRVPRPGGRSAPCSTVMPCSTPPAPWAAGPDDPPSTSAPVRL
jgi:hypothetical protein